MNANRWKILFVFGWIIVHMVVVFRFVVTRKSGEGTRARMEARLQEDFDNAIVLGKVDVMSLPVDPLLTAARLRMNYSDASVGVRNAVGCMVRFIPSGDATESVGYLEETSSITAFDLNTDRIVIEVKLASSFLITRGSPGYSRSNGDLRMTAIMSMDHLCRSYDTRSIMSVNGKCVDVPDDVAPLVFPDRELVIGDRWVLESDQADASRLPVLEATAELAGLISCLVGRYVAGPFPSQSRLLPQEPI